MYNYMLVFIAVILLAVDFSFSKLYQSKFGTSVSAGLTYNTLNGLFTAIIFFALPGFKVTFSPFSVALSFIMAVLSVTYVIIGFKILNQGNMAIYTLFLMTGGMLLPYIFGLIFLNEAFSVFRLIGLLLILGAIILSNLGRSMPTKKQIILCILVFVLNGFVSIVSKIHQIDTTHGAVNSTEFVMLTGVWKFILCGILLPFFRKTKNEDFKLRGSGVIITVGSAAVGGISFMLQLIGATDLPATVLYPLVTGGSIIFSALAGRLIFKEKISRNQIIGIILCLAGTCLFI